MDPERAIMEMDPFNAECRAYGRLEETDSQHLAAGCYGYLLLNQSQENAIEQLDAEVSAEPDPWDRQDTFSGKPLRCLVKEYLEVGATPFTPKQVSRIKNNIRQIHKLGIVIYDVRLGNYINGNLIDFSQAHTVPHFDLDLNSRMNTRSTIAKLCAHDLADFDAMMTEWNDLHPEQPIWARFLPNRLYGRRLRDNLRFKLLRQKMGEGSVEIAEYDWKNSGKSSRQNGQALARGTAASRSRIQKPKPGQSVTRKRRK